MGTRSTIKFISEWVEDTKEAHEGDVLVNIYQQYNGYIDGVGHTLAKFLKEFTMINGISGGQDVIGKFANGMGCLAAQFILLNKERVGGLYVTDPDNSQEYNYLVYLNKTNNQLMIKVDSYGNTWEGTPEELLKINSIDPDNEE